MTFPRTNARPSCAAPADPGPAPRPGRQLQLTAWGAYVAPDLLEGCESEVTRLHFVRTRPLPLPTEPLRSAVLAACSGERVCRAVLRYTGRAGMEVLRGVRVRAGRPGQMPPVRR